VIEELLMPLKVSFEGLLILLDDRVHLVVKGKACQADPCEEPFDLSQYHFD
jgi:hypothetical protein